LAESGPPLNFNNAPDILKLLHTGTVVQRSALLFAVVLPNIARSEGIRGERVSVALF
jgi:hypothetical protein